MYPKDCSVLIGKLERVKAALNRLKDRDLARRHKIPPVADFNEMPKGVQSDGHKADICATLSDYHRTTIPIKIAGDFRTRPMRKRMRKMISEARENGEAPIIIVYGSERLDTIIAKVAKCIRIGLSAIKRVVNWNICAMKQKAYGPCIISMPVTQDFHRRPWYNNHAPA